MTTQTAVECALGAWWVGLGPLGGGRDGVEGGRPRRRLGEALRRAWMAMATSASPGSRGREVDARLDARRPRAAAPSLSDSVESMRESVTRLRRPQGRRLGMGVSEKERRARRR